MAWLALIAVLFVVYGHAHGYNNYGNPNTPVAQLNTNYDPSVGTQNAKALPLVDSIIYPGTRLAKPCRRRAGVPAPNYYSRSIKQLDVQRKEDKLNVDNQKLAAPALNSHKLQSDNETKQIENFHKNPFASELSRNLDKNSDESQNKMLNNSDSIQTRQYKHDICKEKTHSKHAGLTAHEIHHLASHEHLNDPYHKDSHEDSLDLKSNNPETVVKTKTEDQQDDDLELLNKQDLEDKKDSDEKKLNEQYDQQGRKGSDETSQNLEDETNEDCDESDGGKKQENENESDNSQIQESRRALNNGPPQYENEDKKKLLLVQNSRVCYACSTASSQSCLVPDRSTKVKYCLKGHDSCITKVTKGQGNSIITRDCGNTCEDETIPGLTPKYSKCSVCHSDLCNGSFSLNAPNSIFLLAAFIFTALKFV